MAAHLQDLVTAQSVHRWDVPAVLGDSALTYGQLETKSDQLAHVLREAGCRRGDRVGVLSRLRPEAVVAMVAIYKADCAYVPLDVDAMPADLAWILYASQPQIILTEREAALLLDDVMDRDPRRLPRTIGSLDRDSFEGREFRTAFSFADIETVPTRRLVYRNWPTDAAHILFKASPTGAPKGEVISHDGVQKFVSWANHHFGLQPRDRQFTSAPLASEACVYGVLGTLTMGATAHVPGAGGASPSDVATFMRNRRVTAFYVEPHCLSSFADADVIQQDDFPSLKRVVWSGDDAPVTPLRYWMRRLPHTMFSNLHGFLPAGTMSGVKSADRWPGSDLNFSATKPTS